MDKVVIFSRFYKKVSIVYNIHFKNDFWLVIAFISKTKSN